jgi:hypothetical protein
MFLEFLEQPEMYRNYLQHRFKWPENRFVLGSEPKFFYLNFQSLTIVTQLLNPCFPTEINWVRFAETYIGHAKPDFSSIIAK